LNGGDEMPTLDEIRQNILPFIDEYGIKRVGVFGSLARGEATESSDIDLVFDFQKEFGLIALSGLKIALEEKLDKKVDIVEFSSLDPSISESIKDEVVMIYEQG
jgi:predicted nucleotidyltransferase